MKKMRGFIIVAGISIGMFLAFTGVVSIADAATIAEKLKGKILLQVQQKGEAWYVRPDTGARIYLGRPADAFRVMRERGIGITNADIRKIPIGILTPELTSIITTTGATSEQVYSSTMKQLEPCTNALLNKGTTESYATCYEETLEKLVGMKLTEDSDKDGYDDITEILNNYDPFGKGTMPIDPAFTKKMSGRILLQVQQKGEAWYVDPKSEKRYFLGRPADAFFVMRGLGLGISNANLAAIAVDGAGASIKKFSSSAEFTTYVDGILKKQKVEKKKYSSSDSVGQYFGAETSALTEATSSQQTSITNTQEKGVDEGDIVKAYKDYLIVLRRGRLFTMRLAESGKPSLVPRAQMNVFPGELSGAAWYDEMLITGSTVIVVGYRYSQRATEINLFTVHDDGTLARGQTYFLDSDDYYSSRNYTSRLIGNKLIFYVPYYPHWSDEKRKPLDLLPSLRKWVSDEKTTDSLLKMKPTDVSPSVHDELYPTLHTVVLCDVGAELSCSGKAMFGPSSRNYYVSQNAVYLWVTDTNVSGKKPREPNAYVYRIDIATGGATVIRVDGSPTDQFSFQEKGDTLNVLVRSNGGGDAMWKSEHTSGSLALLRIPLSQFTNDPVLVARDSFTPLPEPKGYGLQNRFVGDSLLYGAGGDWQDNSGDPQFIYVKKTTTGDPTVALSLSHTIDRIDAMANDAVVVGRSADELALLFSSIELGDAPRLTDTFTLKGAAQGELRSHGLFYQPHADGGGILGLPIRTKGGATDSYTSDSASVLFLQRATSKTFTSLGELARSRSTESFDDQCVASCVDWYGNARPIFTRDRIFALLGYDLIEGILKDAKIETARSASFYRK